MSSTTRTKAEREGSTDFYATPAWAIRAIQPVLARLFPGTIDMALEPAAGDGAIIRALNTPMNLPCINQWRAVEIRSDCEESLRESYHVMEIFAGTDFLTMSTEDSGFSLAISNPPYNQALEFVQASLKHIHENGWVFMLMRLAFLAGQKRSVWMCEHMPDVYVLPKRPSFTGHGTDSADYAWMAWRKQPRRRSGLELLEVPAC